jgi:cell division protein ZapA
MAQVTLRINGYAYTVGCQDGEEQHLQLMAGEVERRIEGIKSAIGQSGESRMLVMAALMMADDLYEAEKKLQAGGSGEAAPAKPAKPDPRLGRKLGKLAKQAEDIAARLEHP